LHLFRNNINNIHEIQYLTYFLSFSSLISGQSITKEELKEHVNYLASDELEGRKPGTEGDKSAAEYIRNEFKKAGLTLLGEEGYQYFDIIKGIKHGSNNHLYINDFHAKSHEDNMPFPFSGNGTVKSKVVFVGYGFDINEDDIKWNDYAGTDVKGKWVLVLRGDPEMKDQDSKFIPYSSDRTKVRTAIKYGAAGVLMVSGKTYDSEDKLIKLKYGRGNAQVKVPVIHIIRPLADKILDSEKSVIDFENEFIDKKKPNSFETKTTVKATVDIEYIKTKTQNVIAMLPGGNKTLSQEYIIIGGHYDHLGMGGRNSGSRMPDTSAVHNGADDNASGVASMLEIAEQFNDKKYKNDRSIIFMAFGAEETGLLGSAYYTRNPIKELSKTYAMINLDMVGRLSEENPTVTIAGTGTAEEFNATLDAYKEKLDFDLAYSPDGYGASDHSSFYGSDIPVLFFNTGAYQDYHTPFDDTELLNFEGQEKVTQFVFDVLYELSNRRDSLTFVSTGSYEGNNNSRRSLKVTLGIIPGFGDTENKGLRVDGTRKGGPAEKGGMMKGDVITAVNGEKIENIYEYMDILGKLEKGQRIMVDVVRKGEKLILAVQL